MGIEWKKLGINLSNLFDIKRVEIKNGELKTYAALPNKSS